MHLLRAVIGAALLATLCGCPDDPDEPTRDAGTREDAGIPDAGAPDSGTPDAGPPDSGTPDSGTPDAGDFLSEVPLWRVDPDASHTEGCFGRSVALADVTGDGRKDLLVTAPPCLTTSKDPGRISVFKGEAPFFSKQAFSFAVPWQNTNVRTNGNSLVVTPGNIDGDAFADVLVSGTYGAMVFKGQADPAAMFSAPLFRVPGNGVFSGTTFADLDGDGRDDLIGSKANAISAWRAQESSAAEPFVLVPRGGVLMGTSVRRAGDVNGDGAQDVVVYSEGAFSLYLGCKQGGAVVCEGLLSAQPVWTRTTQSLVFHPDLNGDGVPELFMGPGGGSLDLYLSDGQGGHSATPVWSVVDDPAFSLFGSPIVVVGDMDGDGQAQDFVVGSMGRLYFFSPAPAVSAALRPSWAWPRSDRLPPGYEGYSRFAAAAAGDLDGNGANDLVVGIAPPVGLSQGFKGRVVIFGGGAVPAEPSAPPYLPERKSCGLTLDPENGKPDLGVDADVLARTLYVERRSFAADSCEVLEGCVPASGERRLLRFSTSIQNLGSAAATVPPSTERPDLYVFDECHGHEHLTDFAGYALRDAQGHDVVTGRKQGFYLVDYDRQCTDAAPYFTYIDSMGISPGWSDIYVADIPCQWIDITDLTDGTYTLRVGVDEKDIVAEEDRVPNEARLQVHIEGDRVTVLP